MKNRFVTVGLALLLLLTCRASAQNLEPIGALPKLDADWEACVDAPQPRADAATRFRWVVFRNKSTGDFLSFAANPDLGKPRDIQYLSDTALEIFPNGRAVWTQHAETKAASESSINVVSIKAADVGGLRESPRGEKVLEYCFVSEAPDRGNLMAQGRAWIGPKGAVFVQHTSAKPITSDFVDQVVKSLIRDQLQRPPSSNR